MYAVVGLLKTKYVAVCEALLAFPIEYAEPATKGIFVVKIAPALAATDVEPVRVPITVTCRPILV